LKSTKLVCGRL